MTDHPPVLLADISGNWILAAALAAFIVWNLIRTSLRVRTPAQLPDDLRSFIHAMLPDFVEQGCFLGAKSNSFRLPGQHGGREVLVTIETRRGAIHELEIEARPKTSVMWAGETRQQPADFPEAVRQRIHELAGPDAAQLELVSYSKGKAKGRHYWSVDALSPSWEWEFKLRDDGQLEEMEIEPHSPRR